MIAETAIWLIRWDYESRTFVIEHKADHGGGRPWLDLEVSEFFVLCAIAQGKLKWDMIPGKVTILPREEVAKLEMWEWRPGSQAERRPRRLEMSLHDLQSFLHVAREWWRGFCQWGRLYWPEGSADK